MISAAPTLVAISTVVSTSYTQQKNNKANVMNSATASNNDTHDHKTTQFQYITVATQNNLLQKSECCQGQEAKRVEFCEYTLQLQAQALAEIKSGL
jgi:hypothetical protein